MLVASGFCYRMLLDESSIARKSQNSPAPARASDRLLSIWGVCRPRLPHDCFVGCDIFREFGLFWGGGDAYAPRPPAVGPVNVLSGIQAPRFLMRSIAVANQ